MKPSWLSRLGILASQSWHGGSILSDPSALHSELNLPTLRPHHSTPPYTMLRCQSAALPCHHGSPVLLVNFTLWQHCHSCSHCRSLPLRTSPQSLLAVPLCLDGRYCLASPGSPRPNGGITAPWLPAASLSHASHAEVTSDTLTVRAHTHAHAQVALSGQHD